MRPSLDKENRPHPLRGPQSAVPVWAQDAGPTQGKGRVRAPYTLPFPPRSQGSTSTVIGRSLAQGSCLVSILCDQYSQRQETHLQGHGRAGSLSQRVPGLRGV